jgi:hypothetical protein
MPERLSFSGWKLWSEALQLVVLLHLC